MMMFAKIDFQIPSIDFFQIIPVLILGLLMAAALCLELRDEDEEPELEDSKPTVLSLGALGLVGLIAYYLSWNGPNATLTFNDMLYNDVLSRASGLLIVLCALFALLAGPDELERFKNKRGGEFCALIFSASLGMVLMSSAASTMVMFLGLELFSIALYLLCIFFPDRSSSRESGMKYFLLSSAASAVLLYGLAMLYGATGTTWIPEMTEVNQNLNLALLGTILVVCGLLFKLAVVPFHFWAPDVYEGAPTTVTAFMSVATKVAALAALWRLMGTFELLMVNQVLFALAALSMLVGNFLALAQSSVKRMLAYSGVANAGYLLITVIDPKNMQEPMLLFLGAYLFGNMGAFLALARAEAQEDRELERKDLTGLFHRDPWLAGCFALCLISLAGLPPSAGFMGKFFLFGQAISSGQLLLPVVGIVGSLVGAGYYLGTAISLFGKSSEEKPAIEPEESTSLSQLALGCCCAGILYFGFFPNDFLHWLNSGL